MNRLHLAILGIVLIAAGLGMAPAQTTHLPLVAQDVYWAMPSSPPAPVLYAQILEPQEVPPEYADVYQQLLERLEEVKQDRTIIYAPSMSVWASVVGIGHVDRLSNSSSDGSNTIPRSNEP